jgi:uncharacterized protein YbjT (DUF2867 family)
VAIAVTGGTGFVRRHLARDLAGRGQRVVLVARGVDRRDATVRNAAGVSFAPGDVGEPTGLRQAFSGCSAVAHLAGINRESGSQTYARVHVEGTRHVLAAAHEAGIIYGLGDHMLDRLGWTVRTLPVFAAVGTREARVRPTTVEDLTTVLRAALLDGRLSRETVAVLGPEAIPLSEAVRRLGRVLQRKPPSLSLPLAVHYALAWLGERLPRPPLAKVAQVRMLAEGMNAPLEECGTLPDDLAPRLRLDEVRIRAGIPP